MSVDSQDPHNQDSQSSDPLLDHFRSLSKPRRILHARKRLLSCVVFGLLIGLLLPSAWSMTIRVLVAWDSMIVLYLDLIITVIIGTDTAHIRRMAQIQDEGRFVILIVTALAAFASLGAIVVELGGGHRGALQLFIAPVTIALSWLIIHLSFALHYAHEFYRKTPAGGLVFPSDDKPDYWDFIYFSLVIGMTAQVSDVGIVSKGIRRTAAAHGFISFVFNTLLLALMVNIAASLL
jgi:uncharacterized membrane protein